MDIEDMEELGRNEEKVIYIGRGNEIMGEVKVEDKKRISYVEGIDEMRRDGMKKIVMIKGESSEVELRNGEKIGF